MLVLVEFDEDNENIIGTRTLVVDGEKIKPDTFYMLKNNRLKQVD